MPPRRVTAATPPPGGGGRGLASLSGVAKMAVRILRSANHVAVARNLALRLTCNFLVGTSNGFEPVSPPSKGGSHDVQCLPVARCRRSRVASDPSATTRYWSHAAKNASDLRREWDLNPRGACTPKAFQELRRLWLESAAPCLNRTLVTGVSLPVAWIGLSQLEIMAKFMATRVR